MCIEYNIMIGVVNKISTLLFALYSKGWDKNYLKICYNPAFILPKRSASICCDFCFFLLPSLRVFYYIFCIIPNEMECRFGDPDYRSDMDNLPHRTF